MNDTGKNHPNVGAGMRRERFDRIQSIGFVAIITIVSVGMSGWGLVIVSLIAAGAAQ